VGLIKAVDRYDPKRHRNLAALARPSIEGEIRHHLRDRGGGPHLSRTDRELAARLHAMTAELTARLRRDPTTAEIAAAAGVDEGRAAAALRAVDAQRPVPLDGNGSAIDDGTEAAEARVLIAAGWGLLDEREQRMLRMRYEEDRSQTDIARELGLSQAHVSRLLRGALKRLRAAMDPAAEAAAGGGVALADPGPERKDGRSGRLLLRLPRSLHDDLAEAAARDGVPLNTYITGKLAAALDADGAPAPAAAPAGGPSRLLIVNALVIALAALAGLALLLQALLG
jgi:RNA polymerase sigma-B factor